jgi:uncharacterized membrane protein
MVTRRRRALHLGVIAGVLAGAVAAVRFVPRLVARRSYRKLAATKATDEFWPPVPVRSGEPLRVAAPLARTANDGDTPSRD